MLDKRKENLIDYKEFLEKIKSNLEITLLKSSEDSESILKQDKIKQDINTIDKIINIVKTEIKVKIPENELLPNVLPTPTNKDLKEKIKIEGKEGKVGEQGKVGEEGKLGEEGL